MKRELLGTFREKITRIFVGLWFGEVTYCTGMRLVQKRALLNLLVNHIFFYWFSGSDAAICLLTQAVVQ